MQAKMIQACGDDPPKHDVLAVAGAMVNPTKGGSMIVPRLNIGRTDASV